MASIDKFELIRKVMTGHVPERTPIALWRHFPHQDRTPEGLAKAHVDFFKNVNPDLLKISPHSRYMALDWGCEPAGYDSISGSLQCRSCAIQSSEDWEEIEALDASEGEIGKQIKGVTKITEILEDQVPSMMTVFSPTMVASKLDPKIIDHIRNFPERVHEGLKEVLVTVADYASAVLDAGSTGLFLATQHCSPSVVTFTEYQEFELDYLQNLVTRIQSKADFIVIHLHGLRPYFKETVGTLEVQGVNWHDQITSPSLLDAKKLFRGALLGGINEQEGLKSSKPEQIIQNLREVIEQVQCPQLVLSPGCVIPQTIDETVLSLITHELGR
ncbi:MAG: uroporphyrinogen decarboxylase family protein [Promethearchaeota archaeon]